MTTPELLYLLAGLVVGWIVRGPFRPTHDPWWDGPYPDGPPASDEPREEDTDA